MPLFERPAPPRTFVRPGAVGSAPELPERTRPESSYFLVPPGKSCEFPRTRDALPQALRGKCSTRSDAWQPGHRGCGEQNCAIFSDAVWQREGAHGSIALDVIGGGPVMGFQGGK